MGAPFRLQFDRASTGGPVPAVSSLAQSTPAGWSLSQPGWLGFIAWSGSDVIDFTHVRADTVAAIELAPDLTTPLTLGSTLTVAARPVGADGIVAGGLIACVFSASDPSVVSVSSSSGGRVARIAALAAGEATLSASCMGAQTQVTLHVSAPHGADAGAGAGADAGGGDDAAGGD